MAGVAGFEPAAYGFGDRCSTSLSYTPARLLSTHSTLFPYSWSTCHDALDSRLRGNDVVGTRE